MAELYGNEMAGYALCGLGESGQAAIPQELRDSFVWASNFQQTAVKLYNIEVVKPLANAKRVQNFNSVEYVRKNICCILRCQALFPLISG